MAYNATATDTYPEQKSSAAPLPRGPHQLSAEKVLDNQRQRLIGALVELIGVQGYSSTAVSSVVQRSAVSRRSFYELFSNRGELLRAAFETSMTSILDQVRTSMDQSSAGTVSQMEALVRPICRRAHEQPGALALWAVEIAADPQGPMLRGALMDRYAELIQSCTANSEEPPIPRSLAATLAGAMHREIGSTVRTAPSETLSQLPSRLVQWMACYHPLPWGFKLDTALAGIRTRPNGLLGGRAPGTLTPRAEGYLPRIGGASSGFRAHANRERVLDAVAQITAETGVASLAAKVVLERAEVPENVFRSEFKNAKGAFMAAVEFGHMKCQALVEQAQTSASSWSEGVGAAVHALFTFLASEPFFTRLAFVDAQFAWPASARRAEEHTARYARMIFGDMSRLRPARSTPRLVAHGLIEMVFSVALDDRLHELSSATVEGTYLALAPFVGAKEAAETASAWR